MKKQGQPVKDFTGKFAPFDSNVCIVLSYEVPLREPDALQYAVFVKAVGGFDPWNGLLTPMTTDPDGQIMAHYLDSMTGALELGILSRTEWPSQLFASPQELEKFLDWLSVHGERFCDRHARMLDVLSLGHTDLCVTGEHAADGLRQAIEDLEASEAIRGALKANDVI